MNQKELNELRRRLRPEKCAVKSIYGCFVNSNKEVVSYLDEALGRMGQEEAEKYLSLLKKTLSGGLGKNLIDVVFSTEQVMDSDEYRLLSALRESELKSGEIREEFFQKIIGCLDMGDMNYLILLAYDTYDVPRKGTDDMEQDSDSVYRYVLCCVCPVKGGKMELGYFPGENEFHSCTPEQIVAAPELGFLFPAFDDRAANIYNVLFYSRNPGEIHQEFIDGVFHVEPPLSAAEQKEAFETVLVDALEDSCRLEVVQAIHERLREKIDEHKESKDPEPLALTVRDVEDILVERGVSQERTEAFRVKCGERFGENAALNPENLIDSKKFEIKTGEATVSVDPAASYLVETRVIDGVKYLLIPAGNDVEVNGLAVGIRGGEEEQDNIGKIILHCPAYDELAFRQGFLADPETMAYNHAYGGTLEFPEERWADWHLRWVDKPDRRFYRYLQLEGTGEFVGEAAYHWDEELGEYMCDVIVTARHRRKGYGFRGLATTLRLTIRLFICSSRPGSGRGPGQKSTCWWKRSYKVLRG